MLHRNVIAALGVLATFSAACSSSSQPTRPVAAPGQIVTVLSGSDGGLRDTAKKEQYDLVAVAPDGGDLYVGSDLGQRVVKIPRRGPVETILDCRTVFPKGVDEAKPRRGSVCEKSGTGLLPKGLAVGPDGTLYVVDAGKAAVWAVNRAGRVRRVVGRGNPLPAPIVVTGRARDVDIYGAGPIAVGPDGAVYFRNAGHLVKLGRDGMVTSVADNEEGARALAVDHDGNIFVGSGSSVRRVDTAGVITPVAGPPLSQILGLAVDGAGSLFVADDTSLAGGNNTARVLRIARSGAVTTVAGNQSNVDGVAVDAAGNAFIPEAAPAHRVLMVGAAAR